MELYDIVKKLTGPISPVGETNSDEIRFNNLSETIKLVDKLIFDISHVAKYKDSDEYSRSKAGKFANDFLMDIKSSLYNF